MKSDSFKRNGRYRNRGWTRKRITLHSSFSLYQVSSSVLFSSFTTTLASKSSRNLSSSSYFSLTPFQVSSLSFLPIQSSITDSTRSVVFLSTFIKTNSSYVPCAGFSRTPVWQFFLGFIFFPLGIFCTLLFRKFRIRYQVVDTFSSNLYEDDQSEVIETSVWRVILILHFTF